MSYRDQQWTAKLPLLLGGVVLALVGFLGLRRTVYLGLPIIFLAIVLLVWSASIREWCAPSTVRLGQLHWGQQSFHEASLWDCVRAHQ